MKKAIILTFLVSFNFIYANRVVGQCVFNMAEIEKIFAMPLDKLETFLLNRNYNLTINDSKDSVTGMLYNCNDGSGMNLSSSVSFNELSAGSFKLRSILFSSSSKRWYLDIKKQFISKGYQFMKRENEDVGGTNRVVYHYTNKFYKIQYYNYVLQDRNIYSVMINKK